MFSEPSCSDCKIELIERLWTQLLLKWINKCVSTYKVTKLNPQSMADVMAKYNKDICANDIDRAMLCTDDMEPFIKYKYPILRLHYLTEEIDLPRRLYIATSIILYHCCMSSRTGAVDEDICKQLSKYEQELILKFCESLCDMEATLNNVERAIREAYETVRPVEREQSDPIDSVSSDIAQASFESTTKGSITTLPSDSTLIDDSVKLPILKFKSSITVLPSFMTETSTYSDLMTDSDDKKPTNVYSVETPKGKVKVGCTKPCQEDSQMSIESSNENKVSIKPRQEFLTSSESSSENKVECSKTCQKEVLSSSATSSEEHAVSEHKIIDKAYKGNKDDNAIVKQEINKANLSDTDKNNRCISECACSRCSTTGPCCGDQGSKLDICKPEEKKAEIKKFINCSKSMRIYITAVIVLLLVIIGVICATLPFLEPKKEKSTAEKVDAVKFVNTEPVSGSHGWLCVKGLCQKSYHASNATFTSYSRCSLICMGPQLWPYPIGYTYFSKNIVALSTNKLEYKFQSLPSEAVHQFVAEAFKTFIEYIARLEKTEVINDNSVQDLRVKKLSIQIDVESDPEPRLRLNTEEAYHLKIETISEKIVIKISSASFCGIRHGLETLTQLILQDQATGLLITLSHVVVKDAPSYRYRGLMIDTGRNYIPVKDLMRTIDAMATVKLNTFHWRISDVTSFPLFLSKIPQLFEYGGYDRLSVYTKEDVKAIVIRAGFRGIRVLIEVSAPGPVGRSWSWSPDVTCPNKNENYTCSNVLCLRMHMKDSIFDALRTIYSEILDMTRVDDIFHVSDGVFSMANCFYLVEDRDGFLDKILAVLQQANKGFMPKLPIIWYTPHLMKDYEAKTWDRLGVQLNDVDHEVNENYLSKFKVIHSSKWDLSCEIVKHRCRKYRTWQEMYAWKSWRNIEVFTIEGGEAVLWTDLVNSANIDGHIWPRAAAVAERLWSDTVLNVTANGPGYVRLDSQRWRMLFRGINVQPVWPIWCSFHPEICLQKLITLRK